GVAARSDGGILIAAIFEEAVFFVDPVTGDRIEISSPTVGSGPTFEPTFLALGVSDDEIFATGDQGGEIFRVNIDGSRSLVSSAARGSGPSLGSLYDLVLAPDGRILIANYTGAPGANPAILAIDPTTGDRSAVSSSTLGVGAGPSFGRPQ